MAAPCAFCAIIRGDVPEPRCFDHLDAYSVVFEPLNPVTPGHLLVVPKRHVDDATANIALSGQVMLSAAALARSFPAANIITSIGSAATQTVFHLHLHVVPRRADDGLTLPWTGQQV